MKTKNKIDSDNTLIKQKQKSKRLVAGIFIVFVSVLLGIISASFVNILNVYNKNSSQKINSIKDIKKVVTDIKEMSKPIDDSYNILFLGGDINYDFYGRPMYRGPSRSDTLILTHLEPTQKQINAISIPRDTRLMLPKYNYYEKANAAYAIGGKSLAKQAIANLTGVTIHRYIALKVYGLINIVDVLGGVDLYVEQHMFYQDKSANLTIDIQKGQQTLNGLQAHHYVRFRNDNRGDIGRIQRQQKFIRALLDKLLSPSVIVKIPELIDVVMRNIQTDLSRAEILKLAYMLKDIKREDIKMVMLPGDSRLIDGISYWVMDRKDGKKLLAELFPHSQYADRVVYDYPEAPFKETDKQNYKLTILNGTHTHRLAARCAKLFKENGWNVQTIAQSREPTEITKLIVQTGKSEPIPFLNEILGVPVDVIYASYGDILSDYTIVLGNDFAYYLEELETNKQVS